MAAISKTHNASGSFSAVGRQEYQLKSFSKTDITAAELAALVTAVGQLNTIMMIGTFTAGTSDVVRMLIEGKTLANDDIVAGGATFTVADVTF